MILKNTIGLAVFIALMSSAAAPALATKAITSPYVTKGRATSEVRAGYDFMENSAQDKWRMRLLQSYGVTTFWDTRVSGTWSHDDKTITDAWAWENKFQLAPAGEWPVDLGVRFDYSDSTNGNPDKVSAHLLAAKKLGSFSNTANLIIGQEIGDDSSNDATYDFAYGISHPLNDTYSLGIEYYAGFKDFDNTYNEQEHSIGPVVYGVHGPVRYQAGVLAGISEAAPDVALKATLSYSFDLLK